MEKCVGKLQYQISLINWNLNSGVPYDMTSEVLTTRKMKA